MKNKIVISIGSLLACIASIAVLIAAVGPPPILRNSMTTNQNVWEKSGSSMSWTGNVAVAGTVSAGTTGTASTNLASYGQLLGAITNGINQVLTGGTNQTYGNANFVNSNGVVNALGPFSSTTTGTASSNLVTYSQMQTFVTPGSDQEVLFNKGGINGTDGNFIWDYTNHRLGIGTTPFDFLDMAGAIKVHGNQALGLGNLTNSTYLDNISGMARILSYGPSDAIRGGFEIYQAAGDSTLGQYAFHLNSSGNIGIGTVGELSKLDVNGGVAIGTYAGSVAAPANGLAVSGVQTNGNNIGIAGVYQSQGSVGISTSEKVITQAGTTNLNVWVGGILVSNITNYHD